MTLFNNNKIQGLLTDRGLENLDEETVEHVEAILSELDENKLLNKSNTGNFTDRSNQEKVGFLRALVEQNWIIIAQNQSILNELHKNNKSN